MRHGDIITIGIDSSTTEIGVAIFLNGRLISTENKIFNGIYTIDKLKKIGKYFEELFSERAPDIVLIEEPAPVRNSRAITSLNQVVGAIITMASMYGVLTIDFVHNRTAKKVMGIRSKDDSIAKARKLYPEKLSRPVTHHECDAIMVVETYKKLVEGLKG